MKIEIGEYVRNARGCIDKVTVICPMPEKTWAYIGKTKKYTFWDNEILKHDKDIKKIIKAGDILRYKLKGLDSYYFGKVKQIKDPRTLKSKLRVGNYDLGQIEVLEILTHEQYENWCYRLEG